MNDPKYNGYLDDCPAEADSPIRRPPPRYLVPSPATFANFSTCPWATTLVVNDHESGKRQVRAVTCKRWGCSYCAPRKIRRLAFLVNGAAPNRWIRLGVQPDLYTSPKEAWEATSGMLPEACRQLRKEVGECEYLRVTELHKSGMPHYHALLRSGFIRQKRLSEIWAGLTGAPVVYIAKIDATFSSFRYMVKYLTKCHRIEWTDRHVSYSRHFFAPADLEKMAWPERQVIEKSETHPWKWLADRYSRDIVALEADGSWTIPDGTPVAETDLPLSAFGLREAETTEPQPPPSQRIISGLEDAWSTPYDNTF